MTEASDTGRMRAALAAFREVFANPALRRLELAWVGSILGGWAYLVALAVYAYGDGGAAAVGLVGVIRMLPAALLSPFTGSLADRYPRVAVMIASDLTRAALMVAVAVTIATDGPAPLVYALVATSTVVGTVFRPAQAALMPSLVRSPGELTAANVASSTFESIGTFLGPAVGGALLAFSTIEVVFAVNAATFLWSALLVLGLRRFEPPRARDEGEPREGRDGEREGDGILAGIATIAREPQLRTLCGLYTAQTLVAGAMNVLIVVMALEVLEIGNSGVGALNAAVGVGGLIGGFVALVLSGRGRLAIDFGLGIVAFGLPLAAVGGLPETWVALVALAIVGIGNSVVDVNALTILQRAVPDAVMGRVLGALEGLLLGSLGIGALVAAPLVAGLGARGALVATGVFLPALTLLAATRLDAIDRAVEAPAATEMLRGVPILALLPEVVLERLARDAIRVEVPAGAAVIREGEVGDRFYVIDSGEVEVAGRRLGAGDSFGEIALLRDVPRTATVTARSDTVLQALEREPFVAAVTGHEGAHATAEGIVAARLTRSPVPQP